MYKQTMWSGDYTELRQQWLGLRTGYGLSDLSNFSALIFSMLPDLNWCGFYLWDEKDQMLRVGPFQGLPACVEIKSGQGVCGSAFQTKTTLVVPDVHQFPGHIACDFRSRSECVIPVFQNDICIGVFDLDSPDLDRFSKDDALGLESLLALL